MRKRTRLFAACLTAALSATGAVAVATPAQAVSAYGCSWPRVCFYLTQPDWDRRVPTASFQDRGYWQNLGSRSRGSFMVYNSRNDDGAVLEYTTGRRTCIYPNENHAVGYDGIVHRIKIVDDPYCAGEW
jgi:hypothetical protein